MKRINSGRDLAQILGMTDLYDAAVENERQEELTMKENREKFWDLTKRMNKVKK